jgi:ferric-dicitrate binding protein FerR (iron transport regulator)
MENEYQQYFRQILIKYNQGIASKEEIEFLEAYYNTFELKEDLVNDENETDFDAIKLAIKESADRRIDNYNKPQAGNKWLGWMKYAAAAVVLISCSVGLYFVLQHKQSGNVAQVILPGGNKATLTLSNGTRILLDSARNGQIAQQASVSITKTADNKIIYTTNPAQNATANQQSAYQLQNIITTPNGGQYKLELPDGTTVMLNAASSLTYPAAFHGQFRIVQLQGEAYFEVARNKKMPFKVISGSQTVEVLGTHFNINCYPDEHVIKTTLLEGSVRVSSATGTTLIVPGQQAVINRDGLDEIIKHEVDVEKETAWKDGLFAFKNDDLHSVMRQIARWYDIKIVYADGLRDDKFIGEIPRTSNLSDVFKILELNNVHFQVNGKVITVSAK